MNRFEGMVNDTYDWFLLADPANVSRFKQTHQLENDLLHVLTTDDIGDTVVSDGILIPLMGINNLAYTIYLNADEPSVFATQNITPTHQQTGYIIEVINQSVQLFTVPYLTNWDKYLPDLVKYGNNQRLPKLTLENGWYNLSVNAGELPNEHCTVFEFCLSKQTQKPPFSADINYQYALQ
ncbi:hypothetical protein [Celerinatantimonas sp. MCCC 1A17872]|uniref:hypothetical protein n=1 Tax=Celerinatantimonas sp. MCCC 1A17872 TaxID=3177514 RepID=UPI0038C69123